jgi:hypothetical protein
MLIDEKKFWLGTEVVELDVELDVELVWFIRESQ